MAAVQLRPKTFLISNLQNELDILKKSSPELFQENSLAFQADPGMNYAFRVEDQLGKTIRTQNTLQDEEILLKYNAKKWNRNRITLPIDSFKAKIQEEDSAKFTIIVGGTGCGKSTRVPQFLLEKHILEMKGSLCRIICTQPRRVAATSIAKRVAHELGEKVGDSVGYAIRGDAVHCRKEGGTITYCTTGVLVRMLVENPALVGISHVVIDEVHERSLELEMLTHFLVKLKELRPRDLQVIFMSATLDIDGYSNYLFNSRVIECPPSIYPVKEYYLDDMPDFIGSSISEFQLREVSTRVFVITKLVEHITKNMGEGAILIFVAGWRDMDELNERLLNYNANQTNPNHLLKLRLLYSRVALEDRKIFDEIKGSGRKVLISTTIAESSITVPDVVYVIDSGTHNVAKFNTQHNSRHVVTETITKANAQQRAGRAGRVKPGICFRLYTKASFNYFPEKQDKNNGMQNVGKVMMNIMSLGEDHNIIQGFLNRPSNQHLIFELNKLVEYRMVTPSGQLTRLGRSVNQMSADPLVSKMLLHGAIFGCAADIGTIAAGLSVATLFPMPQGHRDTKKKKKKNRSYKPPTRSELIGQLTLSSTSDGLSIVGTIQKYKDIYDKKLFCWNYLLEERSIEEVIGLSDVVKTEMLQLKGPPQRKMSYKAVEDIMAAAFLPHISISKYSSRVRQMKLFMPKDDSTFLNAPLDSVLNKGTMPGNTLFTYNDKSGIKPKLCLDFLNKISPEALVIFAEKVETRNSTSLRVHDITISGDSVKIAFLMDLRRAWANVFSQQLMVRADIPWDSPKGQILDIIIRLLTEA